MRNIIWSTVGLCFGAVALMSCSILAQAPAETTKSSSLPERGPSLAEIHWRVSGGERHLLCLVTQDKMSAGSDSLPTRVLRIYGEGGSNAEEVFKYETPDSVLNLYSLGDYDGRLFLTWVGGSAYHFQVLAFVDGKVKQVLYEGSKLPPEFLYDEQGAESILITEPTIEGGKWTASKGTTTVFKWTGRGYEKLGAVPWSKRFQCLNKDSCSRLI